MCSAPKLQCTKYEPNRALSSQGFSYTEIQPFGATGATYGQKCLFYDIFGLFLNPQRQFWWIQMAPTGHPGCIQPRSIEIQPFGATRAFLWHFQSISDPPGSPGGNFVGSKWHQQAILNVSCPDPTDIQLFGVTSAAYGQNGLFYGIKSIVPP